MNNNTILKVGVADPMDNVPKIGEEIAEIFLIHGEDVSQLGIDDIETKESLSSASLSKAASILGLGEEFVNSMKLMQQDYRAKKQSSRSQYSEMKRYYQRLKKITPLLRGEFVDGIDVLDDIVSFFGVENEQEVMNGISSKAVLYRTKTGVDIDEISLAAWLRRGELDFRKEESGLPDYNKEAFIQWIESRIWYSHTQEIEYFKDLPSVLHTFGISLILLPYMPRTVFGAVEWINEHPVIMVSDRDQDLATCWFTLFHEFGHVILHENDLSLDAVINDGATIKREREANKFANQYLYNGDGLRKYVFSIKNSGSAYITTNEVASKFGVQPMFAGYWMRKAGLTQHSFARIPISFADSK